VASSHANSDWNKREFLHKKRVQFPQDWFGTPIWLPRRLLKQLQTSEIKCQVYSTVNQYCFGAELYMLQLPTQFGIN